MSRHIRPAAERFWEKVNKTSDCWLVVTIVTIAVLAVDTVKLVRKPDPQSLDATRPVDLDDCSACDGEGCIVVEDEDTAWRDACWSCGGDGQRGAL